MAGGGEKVQGSIGLRAKTARAIAVLLVGPIDSPVVLARCELSLVDPDVPATAQPYHGFLDVPWEKAETGVRPIAALIEDVAAKQLAAFVELASERGVIVASAGIVGAGQRDLGKIGSSHIRAHAAEGVLFRQVLVTAAQRNGLFSRALPERELERLACSELARPAGDINRLVGEMGRSVGRPWRADEKAAAIAAWIALVSPAGQ